MVICTQHPFCRIMCVELYGYSDTYMYFSFASWTVDMLGPPNTLYEGETFSLSFSFGPKYPFDSPVVVFQGDNIPVHPHVYREDRNFQDH